SDPSPGPSPTIPIPDPIPEGSGGNLGSQSSSDKSLSGSEVWLKTVKRKNQNKEKVLNTSKRRSVFKQGRKTVKSSKDERKTDKVDEKGESTAQQQSTDRQDEGTGMQKVSTARTKLSTDKVEEDDETIAQVLLNMSQAKAVSKEKEKGVEIRNDENAKRPRTTSTRSVLTLKSLPKTDPNDKGKKRIEEDEESDTESEEITEAKKKFDQIAHDEEVARKMQEDWETEEERKRLTKEEATKTALSNEYDFIQARIEADRLLAERVQEAEREQFTVEERAKFLHDTIATQRRLLAQQRSEAIRNKPPTKNQFRNQMMTYLKHVGNKKHADLKTKSFDEIKALYEKVKRFDDSFITIGSTEDESKIKEMNEGASDPDKKKKIVKEDVSAKIPAKQDVAEQGTKKRKGGHMKMIARKRKRPQPDVDNDDEHRKCLKIITFEGTIDSEIMEIKSFISKLDKVSSPEGDYLVVCRQYSESTPEGIELILWGDLKIMMESSIEVTDQEDEIPPPPPSQTPTQQTPHTVSTIKLPILKKGEYDIWAMKMEHYLAHTDYPIWEVIQRGNGPVSVSTDTNGLIKVLPPKTAEEILARERERKARTTLLMALPEDHLAKFHKMTDAKEMCPNTIKQFGQPEIDRRRRRWSN
ncbi:hypothetical protein Tco_0259972, partial [Tanacetum coccineum]